jgi:hypothetical protein
MASNTPANFTSLQKSEFELQCLTVVASGGEIANFGPKADGDGQLPRSFSSAKALAAPCLHGGSAADGGIFVNVTA